MSFLWPALIIAAWLSVAVADPQSSDVLHDVEPDLDLIGRSLNQLADSVLEPRKAACVPRNSWGRPVGYTQIKVADAPVRSIPTFANEAASKVFEALGPGSPVFQGAMTVAAIAGAVFVIVDLVLGNYVGAIFGLVGAAAGLGGMFLGPAGFIVGTTVGLMLSIMPGKEKGSIKPAAPRENVTQIIQRKMFGDRDHTGNEKCQAQAQANSTCTAVYGAGVISTVFDWDSYEAVTFMIQFNEGFAMSIPDIAKAFHVNDPKVEQNGADKIATIDCHNTPQRVFRGAVVGDNANSCGQPTFGLKKQLIRLPYLKRTAAELEHRIIPKAGGDCIIVDNLAEPVPLAGSNMTITASPVAIACNVSAQVAADDGTIIPLTGYAANPRLANGTQLASKPNNWTTLSYEKLFEEMLPRPAFSKNQSHLYALSNVTVPTSIHSDDWPNSLDESRFQSTDNNGGHYVAPPAKPSPFAPLNERNSITIGNGRDMLRLPNGTYKVDVKGFGTKSTRPIKAVTMPLGAHINFTLTPRPNRFGNQGKQYPFDVSTNQTTADVAFAEKMKDLEVGFHNDKTFAVHVATIPPSACLFSEVNFSGRVACFGVGGGNMTDDVKNKAKSMRVLNNTAQVWIYPNAYADPGAALITHDVSDLKYEIYGTDGHFSENIAAMWIREREPDVTWTGGEDISPYISDGRPIDGSVFF